MPGQVSVSPADYLKLRTDLLFSQYKKQESGEALRTISEYFAFLSIHAEELKYNGPSELLDQFEAVCLLLRDHLRPYPDKIRDQVNQLLQEEKLERVFALLTALRPEELRDRLRVSIVGTLAASFNRGRGREANTIEVTRSTLFNASVALSRLSQILRYAATISTGESIDYDLDFNGLKDHYDPALIEKARLLALIGILKGEVEALEDDKVRKLLSQRIGDLEEDIRKPKPRWGRIIAVFFVLFSFVGDLKTVSPNVYDSLYRTIETIMAILHQGGTVEHNRKRPLLPTQFNTAAVAEPGPTPHRELLGSSPTGKTTTATSRRFSGC